MRAFRHRDFRLLWIGAFLSFVGSWIQSVALGALVYDLTHDEGELGLISFCQSAPAALLGPIAGTLTDTIDKRKLLIFAQVLLGTGACWLAYVTHTGRVTVWHIRGVAVLFGLVGTFETPTRQSIVSRVVPPEDLAEAIPINAMTFNLARVIGPAIGGLMLQAWGPASCFFANGVSYLTLIIGVMFIASNLKAGSAAAQPIRDLLLEGMFYTFRDMRLRTLFLLEATMSAFGLIYLALMPAYAESVLHVGKKGLGFAMTMVGVGAMIALFLVSSVSKLPIKGLMIRCSLTTMGVTLLALSITRTPWVAYCLLPVLGVCTIMQFNLTNTLFQLLSPDRLRGRVISMHVWAISGLAPVGALAGGWIGKNYSVGAAVGFGGVIVLSAGIWSWVYGRYLNHVDGQPMPA